MPDGADRDPCGTYKPQILTDPTGVIETPNYPENYGDLADCSWLIQTDEDSVIVLTYEHFQTEFGCVSKSEVFVYFMIILCPHCCSQCNSNFYLS